MIQCLRRRHGSWHSADGRIILCSGSPEARVREGKESLRFVSVQEPLENDGLQITVRKRLGETRGTKKDWLSAIADLQQPPCSRSAKTDDHMAGWATASSLQLSLQVLGANRDSRIRDSRWDTGTRADQMEECKWSAVKLPSFAKPADGRVQVGCRQKRRQSAVAVALAAQCQPGILEMNLERSSCAANPLVPIC